MLADIFLAHKEWLNYFRYFPYPYMNRIKESRQAQVLTNSLAKCIHIWTSDAKYKGKRKLCLESAFLPQVNFSFTYKEREQGFP
jgi:hypothetical protein